jgi:hypothetical protein
MTAAGDHCLSSITEETYYLSSYTSDCQIANRIKRLANECSTRNLEIAKLRKGYQVVRLAYNYFLRCCYLMIPC